MELQDQAGELWSVRDAGRETGRAVAEWTAARAPRRLVDVRSGKPTCGMTGGSHGLNWVVIGGEATLERLTQSLRGPCDSGSVREARPQARL